MSVSTSDFSVGLCHGFWKERGREEREGEREKGREGGEREGERGGREGGERRGVCLHVNSAVSYCIV